MKTLFLPLLAAVSLLAAETKAPQAIDEPRNVTVSEKAVVPLFTCSLQGMLLAMPENELVRAAIIADTHNWKVESANGDQPSRYISIKVIEPLTKETTLNVISDHGTPYTFRLELDAGHCDSRVTIDADTQLAAHIVSTKPWLSPAEADALRKQLEESRKVVVAEKAKVEVAEDKFKSDYPSTLVFDYHYDKKIAAKMGILAVFHDAAFTYVKAHSQEPPVLTETKEGKPSIIQFSFKDGVYSTARIIDQGYLAVGGNGNGKHQQKLEFKRVALAEAGTN
jgi:type IV secretory pathway VirB9-like protein